VYDNDVNGSRVRNTIQGSNGSDNFYFNGADGKTEAVSLVAHGSNLIYNILGAGGDNLGQVKVVSASPTRYYYLKDHLGSIKVTVNTAGAVVGYDDYYPYGLVMTGRSLTASEDGRYKFTGKERDASDGLDYFGARYYDSWNGRWGQVDPKASKYPAWSSYNYVENNPLVNNDFDGMEIDVRSVEPKTLSYIINDWNSISAAKFKVSDGMLVQDIPSATFTLNGETITMNGVQIQDDRNEALTFINNAINDPTRITVFNSDKLSSQTEPNEVQINLNSSQINKFITNTTGGLDNRTMGYGMTLLHELGHSMIGDKYLNNGHGQLEDDDRPGKTGQ
jgi:RHS repeat-associated protein